MAHTLSTHAIARIVGSQAFSRGERYARQGYVTEQSWSKSGLELHGTVSGTAPLPYSVVVHFTLNSQGIAVRASGTCSCPMDSNCKHVAALLLASASPPESDEGVERVERVEGVERVANALPDRNALLRELQRRGMPDFPASPERAPAVPDWQKALAPLARHDAATSSGTPVALQFELLDPVPTGRGRSGGAVQPQRLGARPVVMGKKNKWIRGSITWDNIGYVYGTFNKAHLEALTAIYSLYSTGQRFHSYTEHWIHLDGFANRALWEMLADAQAAGLPLVSTNRGQDPVTVSTDAATIELDIRRDRTGLTLGPVLRHDGRRIERSQFGLIGTHGVFTWTGVGPNAGHGDGEQLTLAPLSTRISDDTRNIVKSVVPVSIPADDEAAFLAGYYPQLRQQLALTSHDRSFEFPVLPVPLLALEVSHETDARINVHWEWHYVTPPADNAADAPEAPEAAEAANAAEASPVAPPLRHALYPAAGETGYRDTIREAAIRKSVETLLAISPTTAPPTPGITPELQARATLEGSAMIDFLATTIPAIEALRDVIVHVSGDAPDYREAEAAPVISLATTERADNRDWFNLAVTVSIDGEDIPFDDLFRALATEQDVMILPTGTWFSLDRPELHDLRRLIEEARGLQEAGAPSLGLSRFQTDLWAELQLLGVVAEQAAAWRDAVVGLTDAGPVTARDLPTGVNAVLRGYQQSGFEWLSFLYDHGLGGILADDMGLGKTLQAIALIVHARDQQLARNAAAGPIDAVASAPPAPFLVVAPTSVVPNWAAECARFAPGLTVATITETTRKRGGDLAQILAGADVVITSYTLFRLDFDEYNRHDWAGLLLDEAQFVKNHQSKAHQCARRLKAPFKLAITGTPMENNLMELWSLVSITAPGLFPSPSRFTDYYQKPIEKDADNKRLAQLRRRIRPFMLRRTKDEVASDLPDKQEQVLELELHPKHRKVYDTHLARERQKVLGLIEDMNANRFEIFRSLTMMRQLSLDASLFDKKYDHIPSTKLDALLEMLEDTVAEGHRTLIFSQFTKYLGKARNRLDAAGISYSYLDGKTRNRAKAIADFKDGDSSVFLISLKAGGFGLNLTEADYVILLDPWWNPATEAQAVDRVHRIGQTKHVMVYRLVSKDTIEEKVMALKATKAKLFESVMSAEGARATALTAADIRELLS